jgi:hypothetical protein
MFHGCREHIDGSGVGIILGFDSHLKEVHFYVKCSS